MSEIRRILFPVDFSTQCTEAAPFARDLAIRLGAELTVLHVADPVSFRYSSFELNVRPLQEILDDRLAQRRQCFLSYVERLFPEDPPRRVMLSGNPLEQIVAYTKAGGFDLVMVPEHHHGTLRTMVSESLAAKLMEQVSAAVWTTEHSVRQGVPVDPRIVCALDFHRDGRLDEANPEILAMARFLSQALGGHLILVHVIAESEMRSSGGMTGLRVPPNIEAQLVRARQVTGAEAEYHLESGNVTKSLMEFVCRQQADILVIGRSHWDANAEDRTPHAFEIVHRAPCPVVSVYRTRESQQAVA